MAREGQNPLKWIHPKEKPCNVTITSIVHLPELTGFWKDGIKVLDKFFYSIRKSTEIPFDLMILDNGSCNEVREYLNKQHIENNIQFLYFSKYNLRKLGGMNLLFSSAPGKIVSFTDSDVYFFPGWLEEALKIFEKFPQAGMVSSIPTIDQSEKRMESTIEGIKNSENILFETGSNIIPDRFIDAHRISLGKSKLEYLDGIGERVDKKITKGGVSAYCCAQDFQFTTKKSIINKVLPLEMRQSDEFYDPLYSPVFETKINELGYWRLSTTKYLIHHMGNNIDGLKNEISNLLGGQTLPDTKIINIEKTPFFKRIILHPTFRKFLKSIYNKVYQLLYET